MAYSDFTLTDIKEKFKLSLFEKENLFSSITPAVVTEHLAETLKYNTPLAIAINTEKARSELIVAPILVELLKQSASEISLFSGFEFNVDKNTGLNGVCDYIVSLSPEQLVLEAPLVMVVEAKNDNVKSGFAQCIAEMLAAGLYNQAKHNSLEFIYGVVTTGSLWTFLKLKGNAVWVDSAEYHISNIAKLIGIFVHIINSSRGT